ncbi:helix-turn-helix transcriptional regulator [Streptomyces sp. WAC 01420]|nr:helix-turn-helix transcriptional regulator [Streptomyces sp. WAC 01438]RSM89073.1 helix-turn-helix transcriptional regulator [Streptomyces sp. WAC 01420]
MIATLLDTLRAEGGVRVVTGEPGCGRTAFLEQAARTFRAGPVWYVPAGRAPSARRPGGLHTLLGAAGRPVPRPGDGPAGEALFGALRTAAGTAPLLVCVDDVHRWDAASRAALGHAAARVHAAGVPAALLLTVPGHRPVDRELAGLPLLRLGPLAPADAARLADEATDGAVHSAVREELVTAAEGNPALLLAMIHRLSPDQLGGRRALPRPRVDAETLADVLGGILTGLPQRHTGLLLTTAAAVRATGEPDADADLVRRAAGTPAPGPLPDVLALAGGRLRFHSALLGRAVYAAAPPERRRAAHRALAEALTDPHGALALLHRSWTVTGHAPVLAAALAAAATGGPPDLRRRVLTRAADLTADPAERAHRYTAAAEQAVLAGRPPEALRLLDAARSRPAPVSARGGAELLRGEVLLADGPVTDARESFLLAAALLATAGHETAVRATLGAADAAWSAGDPAACLEALTLSTAGRPASSSPVVGHETAVRAALSGAGNGVSCGEADSPVVGGGPALSSPVVGSEVAVRGAVDAGDGVSCGEADSPVVAGGPAPSPPAAGRVSDAAECRVPPSGEGASGAAESARSSAPGREVTGASPAAVPSAGRGQARGVSATGSAGNGSVAGADRRGEGRAAGADPSHEAVLRDHRDGMRAVLLGRFDLAAGPLRRVVDQGLRGDEPERLLRSAAAALMLGDLTAARRAGARALAAARTSGSAALEPRALEYLAYAELRAGHHQLARTHAEEGLRTAARAGRRNTAAHHHAVLALAASIEGEKELVTGHADAALRTARRHGLAQAATLAHWAAARADLGAGRPREAADRLAPLVRPGARRGHFAVWMLAVPCFVEAAALAGRPEHAAAVVEDFALWAACGADPHAPAQLLRCRALLAAPETAEALYLRALDRHEGTAGDFERARTQLLHGKWLRRRRRLREARARLGEALIGFERCGAHPWAQQTAAELRAGGAAPAGSGAGGLSRLTPQQLRIARYVAEGATNREVALSLSVSTRTVDYHLRNVFATLGVRSRVELARLVEQEEKTGAQL